MLVMLFFICLGVMYCMVLMILFMRVRFLVRFDLGLKVLVMLKLSSLMLLGWFL